MTDCKHLRINFDAKFATRPGFVERLYQIDGCCADCGAPMLFEPKPSLTTDSKTLHIPFRMGQPDPMRLFPKLGPVEPVRIGGPKQGLN